MKTETTIDRKTLHTAIFNCTVCKDHGYPVERVQPPWDPKKGHKLTKKWGIIIGQSPGITESKRSRETEKHETIQKSEDKCKRFRIALTGDAGRRLREWLKDAGFTENQICNQFIKTAVTKCFPGRDNGGDRRPTKKEIQFCSPFLKQQFRLVSPSILVPWGKIAISWFFPKVKKLEEVVGMRLQWTDDKQNYTVICLPHSSNVSAWWKMERNQSLLRQAKQLLSELREESCPR